METVALPLWLFVALVVLSAWALLHRPLVPSVRWYLRRRVNRAIDEINTRLDVHIRPFQCSWNPGGAYTGHHQMSFNGKQSNFTRKDLDVLADAAGIKRACGRRLLRTATDAVAAW